jgi:glycosyltransferase involved in cell wall biosynthesis
MNILVVFPFLLHDQVKHGGAAQILRMTDGLHAKGHSIFLISLSEYGWPCAGYSIETLNQKFNELKVFPLRRLTALTKFLVFVRPGLPPHVRNHINRDAQRYIQEMTTSGKIDVAYLVFTATGEYARSVNRSKSLVVVDTQEIETRKYGMLLRAKLGLVKWLHAKITYRREKKYEKRLFEFVDGVVVISPQEKEFVSNLCEQRNIKIVSSMIDTGKFDTLNVNAESNSLLFFGSFGHSPNVDAMSWFCTKVYPLIRRRVPDVLLNIVGTQSIEMVGYLAGEQINVIGEVDDLKAWIAKATVVVSPIVSGGGSRIKNLETMAMGKALVTTTLGAEGLPEDERPCYLVADTETQFAEAVISLLNQSQERTDLGARARKAVEEHRDSGHICDDFVEWLEQLQLVRSEKKPIW